MTKIITLKYPGTCRDCGESLPIGTTAKWYGRGRVSGTECHSDRKQIVDKSGHNGWVSNNNGVETYQNYNGRCEDAPCCGCCNC